MFNVSIIVRQYFDAQNRIVHPPLFSRGMLKHATCCAKKCCFGLPFLKCALIVDRIAGQPLSYL